MSDRAITAEAWLFLSIMIGLRLIVSIQLIRLGFKKERSLLWLAGYFLLSGVFTVFSTTNLMIYTPAYGLTLICLAVFTDRTFYRGSSSPIWFMIGVVIVSTIGAWVAAPSAQANPTGAWAWPILSGVGALLVDTWHLLAGWQAYQGITHDNLVEDWIKSRYRYIIFYSVMMILTAFATILRPLFTIDGALESWQALAVLPPLLVVIFQYMAWGMPEWFRRFLNRNYKPPVPSDVGLVDLSEEEVMRQLGAQ